MHNYSVIIPFRDCTRLLEKACASVPDRDDIQVLIIDNSFNPIGAEAIDSWKKKNINYLVSSPDKGAGCARNVGLANADGKFVLFLDADDYYTNNAFECFDKYIDSEYDIIFFNTLSEKLNSDAPSSRHRMIDSIVKNSVAGGGEDGLRYKFCNPCAKMIRRKLITDYDLKFQEVPAANDQMFSVWTGHYAGKIKAEDSVVYMITEGEINSSLTKTKNLTNQESRFKVDIYYNSFMKSIGRKDLTCRINSEIILSFVKFGFRTGWSWMKYAWKNR